LQAPRAKTPIDQPLDTGVTMTGRSAIWVAAALGVLVAFQLITHVAYRIDRSVGGVSADELTEIDRYLPARVIRRTFPRSSIATPGSDLQVRVPESWLAAAGRFVPGRVALFVDGRRIPITIGLPHAATPLPRAFLRSGRASVVLLQCQPDHPCQEALLARQDGWFALVLHTSRFARSPGTTTLLLLAIAAWVVVVWRNTRTWPPRAVVPILLVAPAVGLAWLWTGVYATAWARAILAAEALLVAGCWVTSREGQSSNEDRSLPDVLSSATGRWLLVGLAAVLLVNVEAFSRRTAVIWDAREEAWFFLRFFGSAMRAGHFGDWLPNVGSGYPVAANIVAGAYNPLYLLMALAFPSSALSVNLLYVVLQAFTMVVTFLLGRTFALTNAAACFLALSMVASGFFVGHASHVSYLSAGLGLLSALLGLRLAAAGKPRAAAAILGAATWHLGTAGSPEHLLFGFHVLSLVWIYHVARDSHRRSFLLATLGGVATGALLASPALIHFFHQLALSPRAEGFSTETVLAGSLAPTALWNLVNPFMYRLRVGSLDPTMDRFHLLAVSPFILLVGVVLWRKMRWTFWLAIGLAVPFTLLALGRNSPVPLRAWLADHFFLYRAGRAPAGQHRGFALFCLALASAIVLDHLWRVASPLAKTLGVALVVADFVAVMGVNSHVRYAALPSDQQGTLPRFKLDYRAGDEPLLNAPRDCAFSGPGPPGQANVIPDRFSWSGYTNLISGPYLAEREAARWAICGPSRLWNYATQSPHPFMLDRYTPGSIRFRTAVPESGDRLLLWAEVNDGFWTLRLNGQEVPFARMPADLRGVDLSAVRTPAGDMVDVEMVYRAPLSRIWRR
jgi:hypothetical protein